MLKKFIRDEVTKNPYGVIFAEMREGVIHYGWSICRKGDTYNKKFGEKIALGRLKVDKEIKFPPEYVSELESFEVRANKYFKITAKEE